MLLIISHTSIFNLLKIAFRFLMMHSAIESNRLKENRLAAAGIAAL